MNKHLQIFLGILTATVAAFVIAVVFGPDADRPDTDAPAAAQARLDGASASTSVHRLQSRPARPDIRPAAPLDAVDDDSHSPAARLAAEERLTQEGIAARRQLIERQSERLQALVRKAEEEGNSERARLMRQRLQFLAKARAELPAAD